MRTRKISNSLAALIITALLVLVSCKEDGDTVEPLTISLNEEVISLIAGTQQTLTATVTPSGSVLEWLSNKTHVATVDGGVIKAINEGKAKIVAKSGNSTAICEVIVTNEPIPVTGIALNKTELEMRIGDIERLLTQIAPYEATNRKVTWTSSKEDVVSVQPNGTLIAHALGEAEITVTTLDGNHKASCTISVLGKIELLAPSNNSSIRLHPIDPEKKVSFSWRNIEGIDKYIIKISTTDLFAEDDIVHNAETPETSLEVLEYTLNEVVKEMDGNSVPLYWAIFSGTEGIKVLPESRRVSFIPDRREYLRLSAGNATGMQIQKMSGEYHYSITGNGQATVNTAGLTKEVALDSGTVSFQYKSNQALPSLTVHFKKADGSTSGTLSRPVPQSTDWKEMRLEQTELPEGWGKVDDYIQLNFGTVSNYQIQLNAIHLQKGVYTPQLLLIEGNNDNLEVLEHTENYFKFRVTARDPLGNTTKFTQKLPARALLLSFEYKSDKALANNLELFLSPIDLSNIHNDRFGQVPMNNSGQWKEHVIDLTNIRSKDANWGKVGDFLRLDFGEEPSIGMTMEIRNVQIKLKD